MTTKTIIGSKVAFHFWVGYDKREERSGFGTVVDHSIVGTRPALRISVESCPNYRRGELIDVLTYNVRYA